MILTAFLLVAFIPAVLVGDAAAGDTQSETIARAGKESSGDWRVISAGGTAVHQAKFNLNGTIGQITAGGGRSGEVLINRGFWQDFAGPCLCRPGNSNGDQVINILDITYLICYLYREGPAPVPYAICSGDANIDCIVNILDISYLIGFLYKSGPPPGGCVEWRAVCGNL